MKRLVLTCAAAFFALYAAASPFTIRHRQQVTADIDLQIAPVVATAFSILQHDMKVVLDAQLKVGKKNALIKVTVDRRLIRPEEFALSVGADGKLTISGADAHGIAYGLLELSRLMGVSPWEWWADCRIDPISELRLEEGYKNCQAPSVRYRGIFINDEDWGLMPWSYKTMEPGQPKGVIGPKTTAKIFELLLRLRANTYWPPMHACSRPFFLTDGNREVAKQYGIYIGTSHCEPMACNALGEWKKRGKGDYNYVTNAENVRRFWQERVDDVRDQEIIYTLGMRGIHDDPMNGVKQGSVEARDLLQTVINDQIRMAPKGAPKVFIPYKEVLDIYNKGMELPDDITLMWTDDNYGYIRHFPNEVERGRKGGNGVYYHVSYWGRPHDYLWLGTFSPYLLYQQMLTAYDRGIQEMWILNVGDIKPAEYQIELFMDMGWNIERVAEEGVENHLSRFLTREFGQSLNEQEIADLTDALKEYYRLAFVRRPEFMADTRTEESDKQYWSTQREIDWSYAMPGVHNADYAAERMRKYAEVVSTVVKLSRQVDARRKEAFFQLVEYPVHASAEINYKFLVWQVGDSLTAKQRSDEAYDEIVELTQRYNDMEFGKWRYIMDMKSRLQPVFDRVERLAPMKRVATDGMNLLPVRLEETDNVKVWEGLGYSEETIQLDQSRGSFARYVFIPQGAKQVTVYLAFLPTLPVEGTELAVEVASSDVSAPTVVKYHTVGRSEEWKVNVLWNRSVKAVTLDIDPSQSNHTLTIRPLSDYVLLDDIYVLAAQ